MLGRVRPPASSPDQLARPPSKILKNDPLSVYEATLMKLKMGSQRDISPTPEADIEPYPNVASATDSVPECSRCSPSSSEDATKTQGDCSPACSLKCSLHVPHSETMMIDTDCSSASSPSSSCDCQSTDSTNRQKGNVSVIYMFSKFTSARHLNLSSPEAMALETTEGSSTTHSA